MDSKTVSIYDMKTEDIVGTGFFISPQLILTCYHVVVHKRRLRAILYKKDRVIYADLVPVFKCSKYDYAIYECVESADEFWRLGDSDKLYNGQSLFYYCPHEKVKYYNSKLIQNSGMYENTPTDSTGLLLNKSLILDGDKLVSGTSGSPLYNSQHEVVGLHWLVGLKNFRFRQASIPINLIKQHLLKNKHRWDK